ncbi:MAG TPA: iron-sulfur cluster assembly protein, partial [Bacteroidota bacterium]|nr:iron-sulfur cluster assembly protein [Bacteroidota bacterium]
MESQNAVTVTEEQVFEALRDCYDPEIPVNLVDLGLIYDVKIIDNWVGIKMTLTTPGCGMSGMISQNVRNRVLKV